MKRRTKAVLLVGTLLAASVAAYFQANAALTRAIDPKDRCQTGFSTLVTCRLALSSTTTWQGTPDPNWPGSKASPAASTPPQPDRLISRDVTLWAIADCPENSVARRLLCATPSTAPRAEAAVIDPDTGLPLPKPWILKTAKTSLAIDAVHVETPFDLTATLNFYRGALNKRGWTENSGALVTPDAATLTFTTADGPGLLRLSRQDGLTIADLSVRKPAAAEAAIRPQPGQVRLMLGNTTDHEAVITVNDQSFKLAARAGLKLMDDPEAARKTDGPDLTLTPGKYKVVFKVANDTPQQLTFDIAADETWGLLAGPSGVPLPVHLY
jgi:hypothetical protein